MAKPRPPTADLVGFAGYLGQYGLSESTIATYQHHAKRAMEAGGWIARLKTELAPKTKRLARAAARHWADWHRDEELREQLKRLRLPAPRRLVAKLPLSRTDLFRVMKQIEAQPGLSPALRAVLGLMACRGFRDGDCLRMRKSELAAALAKGTLAYEAKGRRRLEFKVIRTYRPWLELLHAQPGSWDRVDQLLAKGKGSARRASAARRVQRALEEIGRSLGLEGLHPHQLRRTYAVEFIKAIKNNSEAVMMLKEHMQWADVTTAMQYIDHLRGENLDAVAETLFDKE